MRPVAQDQDLAAESGLSWWNQDVQLGSGYGLPGLDGNAMGGSLEQSWSLVESDIDGVLVMHWVHLGLQWDLINQVQRGFVFYFWESLSSRNALETL